MQAIVLDVHMLQPMKNIATGGAIARTHTQIKRDCVTEIKRRESMKIVIDISEERYRDIRRIASVQLENYHFKTAEQIIANGTPLPSVDPERKPGKWEYVQYDGNPKIGNWHCSNCRVIVNSGFEGTPVFNYCPICGTKMEVVIND